VGCKEFVEELKKKGLITLARRCLDEFDVWYHDCAYWFANDDAIFMLYECKYDVVIEALESPVQEPKEKIYWVM